MTQIAPRDLLLLLGITVIWGLNLVVSKFGVAEVPPILFTTMRFALLAAVLIPFLRVFRGQMGPLIIAGLMSGAVCFGLMFAGLATAQNVSSVAIAGQLGVPFTTLLSVALLGEVVHWRRWTGITMSFLGIMVMGFDPQVLQYWQSLALVISSAFVGALGLIAVKKLRGIGPLNMQAWFAAVSVVPLAAVSFALERPTLEQLSQVSFVGWGAVVYSALAGSLVGHTGFYYLLQRYPVTSVAPMTVLSPVLSVVFGVWLLGDVLTTRIAVGGLLTLTGVVIITWRERQLTDTGS